MDEEQQDNPPDMEEQINMDDPPSMDNIQYGPQRIDQSFIPDTWVQSTVTSSESTNASEYTTCRE